MAVDQVRPASPFSIGPSQKKDDLRRKLQALAGKFVCEPIRGVCDNRLERGWLREGHEIQDASPLDSIISDVARGDLIARLAKRPHHRPTTGGGLPNDVGKFTRAN